MLVVISELEAWKHFLEGIKFQFKVWTDYKNFLIKMQKLKWRHARWALYLLRFYFTLKHVLRTNIGKADRLSKRTDWRESV